MINIKSWIVAVRTVLGIWIMNLGAKMIGGKNFSWEWHNIDKPK